MAGRTTFPLERLGFDTGRIMAKSKHQRALELETLIAQERADLRQIEEALLEDSLTDTGGSGVLGQVPPARDVAEARRAKVESERRIAMYQKELDGLTDAGKTPLLNRHSVIITVVLAIVGIGVTWWLTKKQ